MKWQLVPVEPTEAQIHGTHDIPAPRSFAAVYCAMMMKAWLEANT